MADQSPANGLYAAVLAAGGSRRLGRPKQLVEIQGLPLIIRSVNTAKSICGEHVIVVLGAADQQVQRVLGNTRAVLVHNPGWQAGLSTSIRTGVAALPPDATGVLIMLADQALLRVSSLQDLRSVWRKQPDRPVACQYGGSLGAPAIFPRQLFPELALLQGDRGAKSVLLAHAEEVLRVAAPEANFDIDAEADLARMGQAGVGVF